MFALPRPLAIRALVLAVAVAAGPSVASPAGNGPAGKEARISLDVKDAAITDVVRLLAEVAAFQVVFHPGTTCSLTLKLTEVRWQNALDVSLRACKLAYDEENGILRVASTAQLMEELSARRQLEELRGATAPQRLSSYRLSYARAQQIAPVLKQWLSPRAVITWDERTNTLIVID